MGKWFLWGGLIGFIVFGAFGFLAGASNNGKALLPGIYGTSGLMWMFLAIVSLIFFLIGLIMVIVKAVKNKNQTS